MDQKVSRRAACQAVFMTGVMSWLPVWHRSAEQSSGGPDGTRWIAFVAFPELTLLDLVGPLQVLKGLDAPYQTTVVAERIAPVITDAGIQIYPSRRFTDLPKPFAVIVPGGPGVVAAMANDAVQNYVRRVAESANFIGSVCTGALVLAAAGLLDGRRASTHWAYSRELEALGAQYVRARWTEDGKFVTSGGVSAGIDMALAIVERLAGAEEARRIQLGLEYDPHPPHGGIDWAAVGAREMARQRLGGTGKRLGDAPRLLKGRPDLLEKLGIPGQPLR